MIGFNLNCSFKILRDKKLHVRTLTFLSLLNFKEIPSIINWLLKGQKTICYLASILVRFKLKAHPNLSPQNRSLQIFILLQCVIAHICLYIYRIYLLIQYFFLLVLHSHVITTNHLILQVGSLEDVLRKMEVFDQIVAITLYFL